MANLWKQVAFNGVPNTNGTNLTTVVPTFPTAPAGSYSYWANVSPGMVVDGAGNAYNGGIAANSPGVQLSNWVPPSSKIFDTKFDIWYKGFGAAQTCEFQIGTDTNNYYFFYLVSTNTGFNVSLYKTSAAVGQVLLAGPTAVALSGSATQSLATLNVKCHVDMSTAGTAILTLSTATNGGATPTYTQQATYTDTSTPFTPTFAGLIFYGGASNATLSLTNLSIDSAGSVPAATASETSQLASTTRAVTITGTATSWTTGTTFALTGAAATGSSISGLSINVATQVASFNLTTGSAVGTLTLTDSTNATTVNIIVANITAIASPNNPTANSTSNMTLTGNGTSWTSGTTFAMSGSGAAGSLMDALSVNAGTQVASFTLTTAASGSINFTDSMNGSVASVTLNTAPFNCLFNLGDVVPSSTTALAASVTAALPTGGSGSYTYAWYAQFNYSNGTGTLISGATSRTLSLSAVTTPALVANQNLWVVCVIADGTSSITTYHRLIRMTGLTPLKIGIIGDSTTRTIPSVVTIGNGVDDPSGALGANWSSLQNMLQTKNGLRSAMVTNAGVSGSSASNWVAGSANMNNALAALAANGVTHVVCRLGVNDAQGGVSASTYQTNMTNIVNALVTAGYKVLLDYPTWREAGPDYEYYTANQVLNFDESTTPLLLSYIPVLDGLINNTSVFHGDTQQFYLSAQQPAKWLHSGLPVGTIFGGAIHPSLFGANIMGNLDANGVLALTNPSTTIAPRPIKGGPVHK